MRRLAALVLALGLAWACPFETTLREYLGIRFWMPFVKHGQEVVQPPTRHVSRPFAGMGSAAGNHPMARLRAEYQISSVGASLAPALAAARQSANLTPAERDEIDLIEAKAHLLGDLHQKPLLDLARTRLTRLLQQPRSTEYVSETRGWLARAHYLLGNQSAAGKLYLDELQRHDSNLSHETLFTSLRMIYGYDGGDRLRQQLADYFDTPEHAAFAIHLITNPERSESPHHRNSYDISDPEDPPAPLPYAQIKHLLEKHSSLLRSPQGANALALLGMRTALRAADPPAALRLAAQVPASATVRQEPDFHWMLASAHYLSRHYLLAEPSLLHLLRSPRSSKQHQLAAAYGLCGVYQKTGNPIAQLRQALWLKTQRRLADSETYDGEPVWQSIYWAGTGWDLGLLLEAEASVEHLQAFLEQYPRIPDVQTVQYALAVRLARQERYADSAAIYEQLGVRHRALRMRQLAALAAEQGPEARYSLARLVGAHPNGIYFNDRLWNGYQRYALFAGEDARLNKEERHRHLALERKLKDDQEELWRAHLLLREVIATTGPTELGQRSAALAIQYVRSISERFGRGDELRKADVELSAWLSHARRSAKP